MLEKLNEQTNVVVQTHVICSIFKSIEKQNNSIIWRYFDRTTYHGDVFDIPHDRNSKSVRNSRKSLSINLSATY